MEPTKTIAIEFEPRPNESLLSVCVCDAGRIESTEKKRKDPDLTVFGSAFKTGAARNHLQRPAIGRGHIVQPCFGGWLESEGKVVCEGRSRSSGPKTQVSSTKVIREEHSSSTRSALPQLRLKNRKLRRAYPKLRLQIRNL